MNSDLLISMVNTKQYLPDHFKTLLGQRTSGPVWSEDFIPHTEEHLKKLLSMYVFHHKMDGVYYYTFKHTSKVGYTGVITPDQLTDREKFVTVIRTDHGKSLAIYRPDKAMTPTQEAWITTAVDDYLPESMDRIYNFYPGYLIKQIPESFLDGFDIGDCVSSIILDSQWPIRLI